MKKRIRLAGRLALLALAAFLLAGSGFQSQAQNSSDQMKGEGSSNGKVVYVCACLGNKSCSCMTEAKMEGPCACGTQGGPPLKAVPKDSNWAKQNRDALAK